MQVWFKDRMVGEARVRVPAHPGAREIRMNVMEAPAPMKYRSAVDPALPIEVRQIILPLDYACVRVTDTEAFLNGADYTAELLASYGVRESECDVFNSFEHSYKTYRWKIIRATWPLLEEIFDYDWFEPADGESDPEDFVGRRDRLFRV